MMVTTLRCRGARVALVSALLLCSGYLWTHAPGAQASAALGIPLQDTPASITVKYGDTGGTTATGGGGVFLAAKSIGDNGPVSDTHYDSQVGVAITSQSFGLPQGSSYKHMAVRLGGTFNVGEWACRGAGARPGWGQAWWSVSLAIYDMVTKRWSAHKVASDDTTKCGGLGLQTSSVTWGGDVDKAAYS